MHKDVIATETHEKLTAEKNSKILVTKSEKDNTSREREQSKTSRMSPGSTDERGEKRRFEDVVT